MFFEQCKRSIHYIKYTLSKIFKYSNKTLHKGHRGFKCLLKTKSELEMCCLSRFRVYYVVLEQTTW